MALMTQPEADDVDAPQRPAAAAAPKSSDIELRQLVLQDHAHIQVRTCCSLHPGNARRRALTASNGTLYGHPSTPPMEVHGALCETAQVESFESENCRTSRIS